MPEHYTNIAALEKVIGSGQIAKMNFSCNRKTLGILLTVTSFLTLTAVIHCSSGNNS